MWKIIRVTRDDKLCFDDRSLRLYDCPLFKCQMGKVPIDVFYNDVSESSAQDMGNIGHVTSQSYAIHYYASLEMR